MCDICHEGGQVLGPFLKPMTHLVHTEYLLAGRTRRDVREVLRDTMYAATVTGSPVQNACRLIKQYETEGRGYYGAALALIGRDREGRTTLRQPDRDPRRRRRPRRPPQGDRRRDAGPRQRPDAARSPRRTPRRAASSAPSGWSTPPAAPAYGVDDLARDEDVLIALNSRNQRLSTFWLTDQAGAPPDLRLAGKHVAILDGEDDFVNMLRHVLGVAGMTQRGRPARPVRRRRPRRRRPGDRGARPRRPARRRRRQDRDLPPRRRPAARPREQPFLAVCLGHQVLCDRLGIPLAYKDIVFQGTQAEVGLDGRPERVGFYNTFVGRVPTRRGRGVLRRAHRRDRPGDRRRPPACAARTSAASSSTPSRSSPSTAPTSCTVWRATCWPEAPRRRSLHAAGCVT